MGGSLEYNGVDTMLNIGSNKENIKNTILEIQNTLNNNKGRRDIICN